METVISSIFNYQESESIIYLRQGSYNESSGEVYNVHSIKLYTSSKSSEDIDCFDIEEELKRGEDWTTSNDKIINHSSILIYGGTYDGKKIEGLINTSLNNNPRFVEEIGKTTIDGKEKTFIYYTII